MDASLLHIAGQKDPSTPADFLFERGHRKLVIGSALIASLAHVLYDHAVTFGDEVEQVWKHRQTAVTASLLLARYFAIFSRISNVVVYLYPHWTEPACDTLLALKIPTLSFLITVSLVHTIMILRLYALYGLNMMLLICLVFLLSVEIGVMCVPLFVLEYTKRPLPVPKIMMDCLFSRGGDFRRSVLFWGPPLLADTVIFFMTVRKTRQYAKATNGASIGFLEVFRRDGINYYLVISIAHILNLVLFVLAPHDFKPVASAFSQGLTTALVSRLVLNLRKQSRKKSGLRGNTHVHASPRVVRSGIRSRLTNLTSLLSIEIERDLLRYRDLSFVLEGDERSNPDQRNSEDQADTHCIEHHDDAQVLP